MPLLLMDEYLYLHCLTNQMYTLEANALQALEQDYTLHRDITVYEQYMNQLFVANNAWKGENNMAVLSFGEYAFLQRTGLNPREVETWPEKMRKQEEENRSLSMENQALSSEVTRLKQILKDNGLKAD